MSGNTRDTLRRPPFSPDRLAAAADHVLRTEEDAARGVFEGDPTPRGALALAERAHLVADEATRFAAENSPDEFRPACRRGCSACCHLHTVAYAPEVLAIVSLVNARFTPSERHSLLDRVRGHNAATLGMDAAARRLVRLPCPLLVEGDCSAHPARPVSCRGWNSLDASRCDHDLNAPQDETEAVLNFAQYVLNGQVAAGLSAGLFACGVEHRPLDLVRALEVALADESSHASWAAGGDPFASAVNAEAFPDGSALPANPRPGESTAEGENPREPDAQGQHG